MAPKTVDSYRFLDGIAKRAMKRWAGLPGETQIPWTQVAHLPFAWTSTETRAFGPPGAPPIARYLRRHPWALPRFLNRTPPASGG